MTKKLGNWGETVAGQYLMANGFVVVTNNYTTRFGEIDIVAQKDGRLVAVEVKTRTSDAFGSGAAAVTPTKLQRIQATISQFLVDKDLDCEVGLMVLVVDRSGRVEVVDEIWLS